MADLIERASAINALQYVLDSPNYSKALGEILRIPTADTPQTETQTETQNSNLTFEKRTMRDCYNCKRYETEGECIECHFEPKDEPTTEDCSMVRCDRIHEDGVACARYPACDDCSENPLNKLKGSERLVKGSEQTKSTISKMEQVDKDINVRSKNEPQTNKDFKVTYTCSFTDCKNFGFNEKCIECKRKHSEARLEDEPQTDCSWK